MQLWSLHTPARYAFVPAEGRAVLFDFAGCEFMSEHIETLAEVRPATSWVYFSSGPRLGEHNAEVFGRLGIDAEGLATLARQGVI